MDRVFFQEFASKKKRRRGKTLVIGLFGELERLQKKENVKPW